MILLFENIIVNKYYNRVYIKLHRKLVNLLVFPELMIYKRLPDYRIN